MVTGIYCRVWALSRKHFQALKIHDMKGCENNVKIAEEMGGWVKNRGVGIQQQESGWKNREVGSNIGGWVNGKKEEKKGEG